MEFDKHVFISYAHIDNERLSPQHQGWVTRFHATLEALLSMRIGRKARIWRDDKLQGNDVFAREIVEQFGHTAILVSVLTPRYLQSDWCTRELREFCEQAERSGGLVFDNKSRVFKVLKTPLDAEMRLPDAIRDVLGYEFFVVEDGAPLELDSAYGEAFAQDYNRRVSKLAWDAAQLLKQIEGHAGEAPCAPPRPTIYLAECSHDRQEVRQRLEAELELHGCAVLPDRRLPLEDEAACVRLIDQWLARAGLSIHLVGSAAGAIPDGPSGQSIVVLQNQLAAERSRAAALPRLIWLPEGTRSAVPAQQAFIQGLHGDPQFQFGADLVTGGIEAFRNAIYVALARLEKAALAPPPPPPPPAPPTAQRSTPESPSPAPPALAEANHDVSPPAAGSGPCSIYLICIEKDRKPSIPLRRFLRDQGLDVEMPAFEGDAGAVREANRQLLAGCDAVLVYYGAGDEAWKRSVDNELKKSKGLSACAATAPRYTYLAEPCNDDKADLIEMEEPHLIDGLEGIPQEALAALISELRGDRAAP